MEKVLAAIREADYVRAYNELRGLDEARTREGVMYGVFILALIEKFDEAEQLVRGAELPMLEMIIRGSRERVERWRDPRKCGFAAASQTGLAEIYAALAAALSGRDQQLADRAKAELARRARPIGGRITFVSGEQRTFTNITDTDDAIGQMLETYCGEGLLYFPFEALRRIEMQPRNSFFTYQLPRAVVTTAEGEDLVFVPLLYAGGAIHENSQIRTGAYTEFEYVGTARRGNGHRDFLVDDALIGLGSIAAIDFLPTASA